MIHGRFTLLGTEQSGKSSLIKSFCEQVNLSHQLFAKISNCPSAIGVSETSECFFQDKQMDVYQNEKEIISVQLSDYNGMMLSSKPNSSEFEMLNNTIDNSNVLYVLINGEFFNENSLEKIIQNLKRKCARIITPYISGFSKNNNGTKPYVIFVVTKSRQLFSRTSITMDAVRNAIKETFNFAFDDENIDAIQPYAVCIETNDGGTSAQIPFLIGIYYLLHQYGLQLKCNEEKEKQELIDQISDNQRVISSNESRNFIGRKMRKSETDKLQSQNSSLRIQMVRNEVSVNNDAVWSSEKAIRNILQNELYKNQFLLISDFTKGYLPIEITEPPQSLDTNPILDLIIVILTAILSMGYLFFVSPIIISSYAKKGREMPCIGIWGVKGIIYLYFSDYVPFFNWIYIIVGLGEIIIFAIINRKKTNLNK